MRLLYVNFIGIIAAEESIDIQWGHKSVYYQGVLLIFCGFCLPESRRIFLAVRGLVDEEDEK